MDAKANSPNQVDWFDANGFLLDLDHWSETLAREVAAFDGVGPLTPHHWKIIQVLRAHWRDCQSLPALSHVCHLAGLEGDCVNVLFRGARHAWRIAGLPDPGSEARAYLS